MTSSHITEDEEQSSAAFDCAALLRLEIEFWREIIASCPDSQSAASVERMHQALALAETKLVQLSTPSLSAVPPSRRDH